MSNQPLLCLLTSQWGWVTAILAPLFVFGGAVVLTMGAALANPWIICLGIAEILFGLISYLAPQVAMLIKDGDI